MGLQVRKERPPQPEKPLRSAGYSAMRRMDDVTEKLTLAMAQAIEAGVVFGLTAGTLYPLIGTLTAGQVMLVQSNRQCRRALLDERESEVYV